MHVVFFRNAFFNHSGGFRMFITQEYSDKTDLYNFCQLGLSLKLQFSFSPFESLFFSSMLKLLIFFLALKLQLTWLCLFFSVGLCEPCVEPDRQCLVNYCFPRFLSSIILKAAVKCCFLKGHSQCCPIQICIQQLKVMFVRFRYPYFSFRNVQPSQQNVVRQT